MSRHLFKSALNSCIFAGILAMSGACSNNTRQAEQTQVLEASTASVQASDFGKTADGTPVQLFTLTNASGVQARITNYGGVIVSLMVPDKAGKMEDVVLGYDSLQPYMGADNPFFGTIVGRFANRIADGKFSLEGQNYELDPNFSPNHMHGGNQGFHRKVWLAEEFNDENGVGVKLNYVSPDGEEGYPGNLSVAVVYTLTNENALKIDYQATTDKATILNLTNHSYFNLAGNAKRDVLEHVLMIDAEKVVVVNKNLVPTGELRQVAGTPFDFTTPTAIGTRISEQNEQLVFGNGYDHSWHLGEDGEMKLAATVHEPESGRFMEVHTTEPGMQLYTANYMNGTGKGGANYQPRYALCLETQHHPDSPNRTEFPTVVLKPGEVFQSTTTYKFSVK